MAAFPISAARAAELIPGEEVHPFRLGGDVGLLVVTVVDYRTTDIGSYIEFSIAIACTHGLEPAPALLPALFRGRYGTGQFVVDLPVSTEVSVKGGKGIWGMPKHQANLDFVIRKDKVWSQYDLDGQLCCRIEVDMPRFTGLPMSLPAVNYCAFRGMLNKSYIYFRGRAGIKRPLSRAARLTFGDHPRMAPLKRLNVRERPLFAGALNACFEPQSQLRTHAWFESHDPGRHTARVVPNYGHLDIFMGAHAAHDVFPDIVSELERT